MTLLTRWEPLREFSTMQDRMNRMNRLFRESYNPEGPEEALTSTSFVPPVDTGQVSADYNQGVLKITLAKKAEAKPKQIKVNVGSEKMLEAKAPSQAA